MKPKSKKTSESEVMNRTMAIGIIVLAVVFGLFFLRSETGQKLVNLPFSEMKSDAAGGKLKRVKDAVAGEYIVVLKPSSETVDQAANRFSQTHGAQSKLKYEKVLRGFSAHMTEQQAIAMAEEPSVEYIEEDAKVEAATTQPNATLGLDRIDQHPLPIDTNYNYTATGAGVDAYIIDSGIRMTHQDFGGRARLGMDFIGDGQNGNDCYGHGTHVAGTVGSSTYGVAKNVTLYSMRVLDCTGSGQVSSIIGAANWITQNRTRPAVANISIIVSGISSSLDRAIDNSIAAGVTYAIAAGNFNQDACNYSPGHIPNAITVGSMTPNGESDYRMGYSNWGPCVDIHAPGNGIISLSNGDDTSTRMMSGTSMASPHVAGVAALYLETHPNASASEVRNSIVNSATEGTMVPPPPSSPNLVLYSIVGSSPGDPPPPTTPPPTSCSGVRYAGTLPSIGLNYHVTNGIKGGNGTYLGQVTLVSGTGPLQLVLEKKQGKNWTQVATSVSGSSSAEITYPGGRSTYRWKVSGPAATNYQLCSIIP